MQDLRNSVYFILGQSEILAAFFCWSSFFFYQIVELVKSCKRIIDLVRQRRNSVPIFRRRGTIFQRLISSESLRRNNYTFAPHDFAPLLVRYRT